MAIHNNTNENALRASDEMDTVLEIRNLSVTFDMERGESRVLDTVDIDIQRNEVLGIVGESGSGKSMFASALLNAVVEPGQVSGEVTYHPPDGGEVDVLELEKGPLRAYRWNDVSMVFQGAMSSFNPTLRVNTQFEETLDAHDHNIPEGMERARQVLSDLHLDPDRVLKSYPHELSGGMQQRALIALGIVLEPEVLVMDEPTAALDLLMQQSIIQLLKDLQEKYGLTLVFITHDLPLVAELVDRLAVMYAFHFVEVGPTNDILYDAKHPYTRALLNATPNIDAPIEKMGPIEGSSPDPVVTPQGCSYHPRCPLATGECQETDPPFFSVSSDHHTACYHREDVAEEIPFNIEGEKGDDR